MSLLGKPKLLLKIHCFSCDTTAMDSVRLAHNCCLPELAYHSRRNLPEFTERYGLLNFFKSSSSK